MDIESEESPIAVHLRELKEARDGIEECAVLRSHYESEIEKIHTERSARSKEINAAIKKLRDERTLYNDACSVKIAEINKSVSNTHDVEEAHKKTIAELDAKIKEYTHKPPPYDVFERLPSEIILLIFAMLPDLTVYHVSKLYVVCRRFRDLLVPDMIRKARFRVLTTLDVTRLYRVSLVASDFRALPYRYTKKKKAMVEYFSHKYKNSTRYSLLVDCAEGPAGSVTLVWQHESHDSKFRYQVDDTVYMSDTCIEGTFAKPYGIQYHPVFPSLVFLLFKTSQGYYDAKGNTTFLTVINRTEKRMTTVSIQYRPMRPLVSSTKGLELDVVYRRYDKIVQLRKYRF